MPSKTVEEMVQELYQAVIGIPESPDENGLIGDIREIKAWQRIQNGRISCCERNINIIKGILIGIGVLGGGSLVSLGVNAFI